MVLSPAQRLDRAITLLLGIEGRIALGDVSASFRAGLQQWRRTVGEAQSASAIGRQFDLLLTATFDCSYDDDMTTVRDAALAALSGAAGRSISSEQWLIAFSPAFKISCSLSDL